MIYSICAYSGYKMIFEIIQNVIYGIGENCRWFWNEFETCLDRHHFFWCFHGSHLSCVWSCTQFIITALRAVHCTSMKRNRMQIWTQSTSLLISFLSWISGLLLKLVSEYAGAKLWNDSCDPLMNHSIKSNSAAELSFLFLFLFCLKK